MKANEVKKGMVIHVNSQNILIKKIHVQSPSSRTGSTLYKMLGKDVVTGQKFEQRYKGDENITSVDFERRAIQFLYRDNDGSTFMDVESYDQHTLNDAIIEEELLYISDGIEGLNALVADGVILGLELPASVTLEIMECSPSIKGASASARTKPATLSTTLVVQVPEYLSIGDHIKVNTDSCEYISRAS